jgi:prolyl-tRNA editing enzyme YbaK/EbsC (Cys-tRNA(Pro) deacylase)
MTTATHNAGRLNAALGLPESVQRVAAVLQNFGALNRVRMLDGAARTAPEAAHQLSVAVGQIAKSIVFRRGADDVHVLVITSGDKRVDPAKVSALVGQVERADAAFVRDKSGYAIGGVPPLAHAQAGVVLLDTQLLRFESLWAAAGHPHGVFWCTPQELAGWLGLRFSEVTES